MAKKLMALAGLALLACGSLAHAAPTPIPIEAIAHDPVIQNASLSPDGKHLVALTSGPGLPITVTVWNTEDLSKPPSVLGLGDVAERANVKFLAVGWVSDTRLYIIARQPLTTGSGDSGRNFTALARFVNIDGSNWVEPLREEGPKTSLEEFRDKILSVELFDRLLGDPEHVLMSYEDILTGASSIFKVNINTGRGERIVRDSPLESSLSILDKEDRIRVRSFAELRGADWWVGYRILNAATNQWEDHPELEYPVRNRRQLGIFDFDPDNPDILFVADNKGTDLAALKGYSISQKAFVETIFAHKKFEAGGPMFSYDSNDRPVALVGVTYQADITRPYWIDPESEALHKALQAQFPEDNVTMSRRKAAGITLVTVSSSRRPPSYYLLRDGGEMIKVADSHPMIDHENLEKTKLVYYTARDGLEIPAFLTLPKGFKPGGAERIGAIILPHGGPWARDDANWDGSGWVQFLASRGYAVLQPQYRGSEGFGDKLWKAGDEQWGLKMQDDKDDGAQWLVDQGIAAPDRLAMFGYSYGGFAAMTAAVRPNSPYQCAIAGAGVSNLKRIQNVWGDNRIQRQSQAWTVKGEDAMSNLDKANIPILIYSGDRDQTVPIIHSREMVDGLKSLGKPVRYFEVEDMPHSLPWWPAWHQQTLTEIEKYLANECGPGGL